MDDQEGGSRETRRRLGVVIMLISGIVFSTAGIFTKGVSADAWSVIFWRGLFAAIFTTVYAASQRRLHQEFAAMGRAGLMVALLGAAGTAAFIPSFKLTTMANVSLIYASSPFVAAGIAWLWFREVIERRILIGAILSVAGVGLVVSGSLGQINLSGDLLALWMTIMMSMVMVVYRRYPSTPPAGPNVMASLLLLPIAMYFGNPFSAPLREILIMSAFGLIFAIASVTLSEGARRLSPGEAALISSLETPLAIMWGWMLFSEMPPLVSLVGGVLILVAVFGSQLPALQQRGRALQE